MSQPTKKQPLRPDYEGKFTAALRENEKQVLRLLVAGDKALLEKIDNYVEKRGYPKAEVIAKIKKDAMFRAAFAIDPARQNIFEKIAGEHIKGLSGVSDFDHLGTSELVILRGGVYQHADVKARGSSPNARTIDFTWKYGGKTFYASHKLTRGTHGGGMQNGQYKDMRLFLEEANPSQSRDEFFIGIADGEFYLTPNKHGETRLQLLKDLANRRNVFAVRMEELPDLMRQLTAVK